MTTSLSPTETRTAQSNKKTPAQSKPERFPLIFEELPAYVHFKGQNRLLAQQLFRDLVERFHLLAVLAFRQPAVCTSSDHPGVP